MLGLPHYPTPPAQANVTQCYQSTGAACTARGCNLPCQMQLDDAHGEEHTCNDPAARCPYSCSVTGCFNACASNDHWHGNQLDVVHICSDKHPCRRTCSAMGCSRTCVFQRENHSEEDWKTVHDCGMLACLHNCEMAGCSNPCDTQDHFGRNHKLHRCHKKHPCREVER